MRKTVIKLLAFLIVASSFSMVPIQNTPTAEADHVEFDKNFLIADSLFTDTDSMNAAQIQDWLEDNGGSLLANWVDDVDMRRPSDNCVVHHATGMTAAEIIYEAAHQWGAQVYDSNGCAVENAYWSDPGYSNYTLETVSPKDLLVLLQKEQSLISANGSYSSNPNDYKDPACCASNEYKLARATGYGVPDSGGINEKYLGFYNQINWAAWQLRFNYERAGGNTSWDEVGYITYTGPFTEGTHKACDSCSAIARSGYYTIDGSPLYMDNRATASLYYYTPHTYPGYYGNYNFVQFYTHWFGPTNPVGYQWELVSQNTYTGSTKTAASSTFNGLSRGDRVYVQFRARNVGDLTWNNSGPGAVWAGTWGPMDRDSDFCDSTWLNCRRPARMIESSVEPGEIATFEFFYNVPTDQATGLYEERFNLVASGVAWMPDQGMKFHTIVEAPERTWSLVRQNTWTDSSKTTPSSTFSNLYPGDRVFVEFEALNTGNVTWRNSGTGTMRAGTWGPRDRSSPFCDSTWVNCRRPDTLNESKVEPGQTGTFSFWYNVPINQDDRLYEERFNLVQEGVAWQKDVGMKFHTIVSDPNWSWQLVRQNTWTDSTKTTPSSTYTDLNPGDRVFVEFEALNTGNVGWKNVGTGGAWVGTWGPKDRNSDFCDSTWLNCRRPGRMNESYVAPGNTGTFSFWYDVPNDQPLGLYEERFNIVLADVTWLPDVGMKFHTIVE